MQHSHLLWFRFRRRDAEHIKLSLENIYWNAGILFYNFNTFLLISTHSGRFHCGYQNTGWWLRFAFDIFYLLWVWEYVDTVSILLWPVFLFPKRKNKNDNREWCAISNFSIRFNFSLTCLVLPVGSIFSHPNEILKQLFMVWRPSTIPTCTHICA